MAGTSWLVDKSRIATKIKCASGAYDPNKVVWNSNPTRPCPNCQHAIDNSDVAQEWPGLPKGVKFDPCDQDIIKHLLAKAGKGDIKPHPFIDEFITTLEMDDGICYTHPQHLPGVKQDGSPSHFFHRATKAYSTGTRKRRKIHDQDFGDVRWHKTGRTKPVILDGVQKGCKKIMVLYTSATKGGKSGKTNWVMHQYLLGTEEEEKDGDYVVSKVLYQQQQESLGDKGIQDISEATEAIHATIVKVDPVTPKSVTPEPPRCEGQCSDLDLALEALTFPEMDCLDGIEAGCEELAKDNLSPAETQLNEGMETDNLSNEGMEMDNLSQNMFDSQQIDDNLSQNMFDSQQMAEHIFLLDDLVHSQSPNRDAKNNDKCSLSVYARLGPEQLKKEIEECTKLLLAEKDDKDQATLSLDAHLEPNLANVERDTPPEHRLSQLEFGSQDSYISFGFSKP